MNRYYSIMVMFSILCGYNQPVHAGCPNVAGPNPMIITPMSPQNFSGPQDSIPHGELIGTGFTGNLSVGTEFYYCSAWIESSTVFPIKAPVSGITYNDGTTTYDVYDSGVPGIGYAVGIKDPLTSVYQPMNYPSTQTYPAAGTTTKNVKNIGYDVKIVFVATGHLISGSYYLPAQTVGYLSATQTDGQVSDNVPLNVTGITVNVISTGCNVTSGNNISINLGNIMPSAFTGVGSLAGSGSTTLSLQCDTGVQLFASMTDQSNTANTTDTLTLTPDSVAKGVGIQFFANNASSPVVFGPDSSSKGLPNAFFIDNSTGDGSVIQFPIEAKYIQTGRLSPGSANGIATITFSYQ